MGRTPLHVATSRVNARPSACWPRPAPGSTRSKNDRYDAVTIAAVADDAPTLALLLSLGANAGQTTSRYDGTALIAAAHLGHDEVVRRLIAAGAPLDHVNNLHRTALIEADRARRRRTAPPAHPRCAGRRRRQPAAGRSPGPYAAAARDARAATPRWSKSCGPQARVGAAGDNRGGSCDGSQDQAPCTCLRSSTSPTAPSPRGSCAPSVRQPDLERRPGPALRHAPAAGAGGTGHG